MLKSRQDLISDEERIDVRNGNDVLKKSSAGKFYYTSNKMEEARSFGIDGGKVR